jgi:hypothetical protein
MPASASGGNGDHGLGFGLWAATDRSARSGGVLGIGGPGSGNQVATAVTRQEPPRLVALPHISPGTRPPGFARTAAHLDLRLHRAARRLAAEKGKDLSVLPGAAA